jgi:hypothetical protein
MPVLRNNSIRVFVHSPLTIVDYRAILDRHLDRPLLAVQRSPRTSAYLERDRQQRVGSRNSLSNAAVKAHVAREWLPLLPDTADWPKTIEPLLVTRNL